MASKIIQQVDAGILRPLFVKIGKTNLIICAIALVIAAAVASSFVVLSVIIGAIVGMTNLSALAGTIQSSFVLKPEKAQRFVAKRYYIRLIVTTFIIGLLVSKNLADPVGLVVGYSIIMTAALASTIYFVKKELA